MQVGSVGTRHTIRSDLLKPVGTRWNPLEPVGTRYNPFRPVETRWNPFRSVGTCRNPFRSVQTRWNLSKHVTIRSDLLEHVSSRCIFYFLFSILHLKKIHLQLVEYEGNTKIKIKIKIIHPPPSSPSSIPHPPNFPHILFYGGGRGGRGGERAGDGDGDGEPPPPPVGPPPFSPLRSLQIKHYLYIRLRE